MEGTNLSQNTENAHLQLKQTCVCIVQWKLNKIKSFKKFLFCMIPCYITLLCLYTDLLKGTISNWSTVFWHLFCMENKNIYQFNTYASLCTSTTDRLSISTMAKFLSPPGPGPRKKTVPFWKPRVFGFRRKTENLNFFPTNKFSALSTWYQSICIGNVAYMLISIKSRHLHLWYLLPDIGDTIGAKQLSTPWSTSLISTRYKPSSSWSWSINIWRQIYLPLREQL